MELLLLPPFVWLFCLKFCHLRLRLIFFFGFLAPIFFFDWIRFSNPTGDEDGELEDGGDLFIEASSFKCWKIKNHIFYLNKIKNTTCVILRWIRQQWSLNLVIFVCEWKIVFISCRSILHLNYIKSNNTINVYPTINFWIMKNFFNYLKTQCMSTHRLIFTIGLLNSEII